jgi:hypothetical protein
MAFPLSLGLAVMSAVMIVPAGAWAQALSDPTRPPAEFLGPAGDRAVTSVPVAGGGQIIILSGGRTQVTMNGQTVKPGAKLGNATVTGISDSQLTTRTNGHIEKLDFYGGVEKRMTNTGPAETAAPTRRGAAR